MRVAALALAISAAFGQTALAVCGERGGPAFRGQNGKCVGWAQLDKVCGTPPTSRCTFEGGGVGDTGVEKGSAFIAGSLVPLGAAAAPSPMAGAAFNKRQVRTDGSREPADNGRLWPTADDACMSVGGAQLPSHAWCEIPDICNRPPHASATLWRTWSHMATHASTRTTQLYDRRRDDVTFDEVAKINIKG